MDKMSWKSLSPICLRLQTSCLGKPKCLLSMMRNFVVMQLESAHRVGPADESAILFVFYRLLFCMGEAHGKVLASPFFAQTETSVIMHALLASAIIVPQRFFDVLPTSMVTI